MLATIVVGCSNHLAGEASPVASPTKRQVSLIQGLQGSDWRDAQVTLLSLEPVSGTENSGFRDWKVLGSAQLSVARVSNA